MGLCDIRNWGKSPICAILAANMFGRAHSEGPKIKIGGLVVNIGTTPAKPGSLAEFMCSHQGVSPNGQKQNPPIALSVRYAGMGFRKRRHQNLGIKSFSAAGKRDSLVCGGEPAS